MAYSVPQSSLPSSSGRVSTFFDRRTRLPRWALVSGLQFLALIIWSIVKYHFALFSWDFAIYQQAAYLISQGHMNPLSTILGFHFLSNDAEFIMYPVALIYAVVPSALTLLLIQDMALAGATAAAIAWIDELLTNTALSKETATYLRVFGMILLLAYPWQYYTASFDFHIEPLVMPFAILSARSIIQNRSRRAILYSLPLILGGQVTATYLLGLGLTGLLYARRTRLLGAAFLVGGVLAALAIEHLIPGGIRGGSLRAAYGTSILGAGPGQATFLSLLLGLLHHPFTALHRVWRERMNIYGDIAPLGFLGLVSPIGLGLPLMLIVGNSLMAPLPGLTVTLFAVPTYMQTVNAYPLLAVGTIWLLVRIAPRLHKALKPITAILAVNTLMWTALWVRYIPRDFVTAIPSSGSALLHKLASSTPRGVQVVATQAFVGLFANRPQDMAFLSWTGNITAKQILFVISPYDGIEFVPSVVEAARVAWAKSLPGAKIVGHAGGIWAIAWRTPPHITQLRPPIAPAQSGTLHLQGPLTVPAWAFKTRSGHIVASTRHGTTDKLIVTSRAASGYLLYGDLWRVMPGRYSVSVRVASTGPVTVQIWNTTGRSLLSKRTLPSTHGVPMTYRWIVNDITYYPPTFLNGWGPWAIGLPGVYGNQLELRVSAPIGHEHVSVYSVGMGPSSTPPRP